MTRLSKAKYIEDSMYLKEIFDNPQQIIGEKSKIKQGYNTVMFSYIYYEDGSLEVRQTSNSFLASQKLVRFKRIEDNAIPQSEEQYSVQIDNEGVCRGMLFYEDLNNMEIEYDYSAMGRCYISADSVYTSYTNKNNVLETLEELVRDSREAIEQCITIGDANILLTQIREYVKFLTATMNDLSSKMVESERLTKTLKSYTDEAKKTISQLQVTLDDANDIKNLIKNTGNPSFEIPISAWSLGSDGLYHYTLRHNLVTNALIPSFTVESENGWMGCDLKWYKKDANSIEIVSDDNKRYCVDLSVRTFQGSATLVDNLSSDDIKEGRKNLYAKAEKYDIGSSDFSSEQGLFTIKINHNLNSSAIAIDVINEKYEQVCFASKVINTSQIKIYVYNKENIFIRLTKMG